MSGEDEKTKVSSSTTPEAVANNADAKPAEKEEPVANGEGDAEETSNKKPAKRKAVLNKKVKDNSDEDSGNEVSMKNPKKKAPQPKKSPVKKQKKEEFSGDESASEIEIPSPKRGSKAALKDEVKEVVEEAGSKKGVPLLDQPLEIEGSRARKTVSRFSFNSIEKEDKKTFSVPEGKGTKLGDIARIEYFITRLKMDNIKPVVKALFGSRGPVKTIAKRSMRCFNGYDFGKDSDQWEKRKTLLSKLKIKELKDICETLDLERSGALVVLVERIMEFCSEPKDSGKKPPQAKKKSKGKSKASKPKNSKSSKRKQASKKDKEDETASDDDGEDEAEEKEEHEQTKRSKGGKAKKLREESSDEENEDATDRESEEDEKEDTDAVKSSDVSEDYEEEEDKKKVKSKKRTKPIPKVTPAKIAKKAPRMKVTTKKIVIESEEEDKATSSEDDEPLVKIAKPSTPTDEDIKTFVKKILEGANLEEITMKTVCKQVYENYPDHDLAHKKNLIKETVKSLIWT